MSPQPQGKLKILSYAALHALWMLVLMFGLLSMDYMHGDEAWMIKNTSAVLRMLMPEPDKPGLDDLAFINVAYDKQLIDRLDADGFPAGNMAITDRNSLAKLFHEINKDSSHKYLVCDVIFPEPSANDSALGAELAKLDKAIFSFEMEEEDARGNRKQLSCVFDHLDLNMGVVDFSGIEDEFLKFRLKRDSLKSLPIRMYEDLHGGTYEEGKLFHQLNGKPAFNDFVLDFRIRDYNLHQDTLNYPYANLHDLIMLINFGAGDQVREFVRDRIVVIGDFEVGDMHPTIFGDTSGPVILMNLYYAMVNEDNLISWFFFIYWFLVFFFSSYLLFSDSDALEEWIKEKVGKNRKWAFVMLQALSYMVLLAVASTLSFVLFTIHINFVLMMIYINGVEAIQDNWEKIKNWMASKKA